MKTIAALIKAMRVKQWTKNVFVLAALAFDLKLFVPHYLTRAIAATLVFCAISSAVYLVNDLADIEKDRQHPTKRNRPLAAGTLSPAVAVVAAGILAVGALYGSYVLEPLLALVTCAYLVVMVAYSFVLKNIVIVDVLTVSAGFVLRVVAGVIVVHAQRFSPWLYLCIVLGALFIAISKRRHELVLLDENANAHRAIFQEYNLPLLDEMTRLVTSCTAMAYSLYTFSAPNLPQNHAMMLTIPMVLYALFRYMYLVVVKGEGGEPDELIFKDKPFFAAIVLWAVSAVAILYFAD